MTFKEASIIISGFGGQGVLFIGTAIANCAMNEDRYVTWMPSYGAEMRGGTANCTVVIANEEVSSPYQQMPDYVIALNAQSVEKFEQKVKTGGTLIINSSLYNGVEKRKDINYLYVPANEIASKIGEIKCANVVMLSAFIEKTKLVRLESLKEVVRKVFSVSKVKLLELNELAIQKGSEYIKLAVAKC